MGQFDPPICVWHTIAMVKRSSIHRPRDLSELAASIVDAATDEATPEPREQ